MKRKINTIISDLGNVIVFLDHFISAKKISEYSNLNAEECYNIIINSPFTAQFGKGLISEKEFYTYVTNSLKISTNKLDYETFKKIYMEIFIENKEYIDFIASLKNTQKILLSNTDSIHFDYIDKKWNISSMFDHIVLSYKVRSLKPEEKIYKEALKICDSSPENVLFIDDIEKYTSTFTKMYNVNSITYNAQNFSEKLKEYRF